MRRLVFARFFVVILYSTLLFLVYYYFYFHVLGPNGVTYRFTVNDYHRPWSLGGSGRGNIGLRYSY